MGNKSSEKKEKQASPQTQIEKPSDSKKKLKNKLK